MINKKWKYSVFDIFRISFIASTSITLLLIIEAIISAAIPTLQIIVTASFINQLVKIIQHQGNSKSVIKYAVIIIVMISYQWIIPNLKKLLNVKMQNKLRESLSLDIIKKQASLKYHYIEDTDTWDLIQRVSDKPEEKVSEAFSTILSSICLIARVAGLIGIIFTYVWWAALLILVVSVPMFYLAKKSGEASYEVNQEVTVYQRKYQYLTDVMTKREASQERCLFEYGDKVSNEWQKQYGIASNMVLKAFAKWYVRLEMGSICTALISACSIVVLLFPTIKGEISIGMFISLVNACFSLVESMSWELRAYVDALANHRAYLKELRVFANLDTQDGVTDGKEDMKDFDSLEFQHVSFKYPGSDTYVLKDVSFQIHKGIHYGLVGKNGQGKTTITKLILGLYDDYEGKILINGKELREYRANQLKGIFSVIYQDFAKYALTLKDSILLGDKSIPKAVFENAVKSLSLDKLVNTLPKKEETHIGKVFNDGVDISGGEWQRVAIARTYVSNSPVHLMDEPTAALDPMAECQIYDDFDKISQNHTTITISHRLGSVRRANEILVIDEGKIAEQGSHEQLIAKQGLYYEMYESQRSWYK